MKNIPRPAHLDLRFAEQFKDQGMVDSYPCRPPYPQEVFSCLAGLAQGSIRRVLDVGCGSGDIARQIAPLVDSVDAVDFSPAMIKAGKSMPGGDNPGVLWTVSRVEDFKATPPYGLIVAGESLHWMDWPTVMPNFAAWLLPGAFLATIFRNAAPAPWDPDLKPLMAEYSTNRVFKPFDLVDELTVRNLFASKGRITTKPESFRQSIDDYVSAIHSRNGFSVERMGLKRAKEFDMRVRDVLHRHQISGALTLETSATVTWGIPG